MLTFTCMWLCKPSLREWYIVTQEIALTKVGGSFAPKRFLFKSDLLQHYIYCCVHVHVHYSQSYNCRYIFVCVFYGTERCFAVLCNSGLMWWEWNAVRKSEKKKWQLGLFLLHVHPFAHYPVTTSYCFLTLRKPAVLEKYLAFSTFFSTAWGLTISSPWRGVKATLDAVPETARRTVVWPPITWDCWRLLCKNKSQNMLKLLIFLWFEWQWYLMTL